MGIIVFDMDEVIYPFLDTYLNFHNLRHGTNWKKDDFFSYEFQDVMDIPLEKIIEELEVFYKTNEFDEVAPIDGAKEIIYELRKKNDLYIASGRISHLKEKTSEYLKRNFEDSFKGVYLADYHPFEKRQLNPKQKICKDLGANMMLEDLPVYALRCSKECDIPVIVPKQPWNASANFLGTKCVLVDGLKGAIDYCRKHKIIDS
jgi:5'(3')-deoxyribonucleotidase